MQIQIQMNLARFAPNLEDGRKVGVQFRLIDSLRHYCGGGVGGVGGSTIKLYQDCGLGDPVWGIARLDF